MTRFVPSLFSTLGVRRFVSSLPLSRGWGGGWRVKWWRWGLRGDILLGTRAGIISEWVIQKILQNEFPIQISTLELNNPGAYMEFLDVNLSMGWLVEKCISEDPPHELKKSPWRTAPPTQTGSLKLLLRYENRQGIHLRLAEGFLHGQAWKPFVP